MIIVEINKISIDIVEKAAEVGPMLQPAPQFTRVLYAF